MIRTSRSQSVFLKLCILFGLLAVICSVVFAASAAGRIRRGDASPKASIRATPGRISAESAPAAGKMDSANTG